MLLTLISNHKKAQDIEVLHAPITLSNYKCKCITSISYLPAYLNYCLEKHTVQNSNWRQLKIGVKIYTVHTHAHTHISNYSDCVTDVSIQYMWFEPLETEKQNNEIHNAITTYNYL